MRRRPALVRGGQVVRFADIGLATREEVAEVINRASGDDYAHKLELALHGSLVRRESGISTYKLNVPRPAEKGSDTVEVFVLDQVEEIVLVEFISDRGFDPALRRRILGLVSR